MKLTADQKQLGRALAIGVPVVAALHYADAANTMVTSPNAENLSSAQNARTLLMLTAAAAGIGYFVLLRK